MNLYGFSSVGGEVTLFVRFSAVPLMNYNALCRNNKSYYCFGLRSMRKGLPHTQKPVHLDGVDDISNECPHSCSENVVRCTYLMFTGWTYFRPFHAHMGLARTGPTE